MCITLFRSIAVLCGNDNILVNISIIQSDVKNIMQNIASPTYRCYGSKQCYVPNPLYISLEYSLGSFGSMPRKCLGIVGEAPSDSKSSRLHVEIFRLCFHSLEVYSIDSSKKISKFPEVLSFNQLCLELNRLICNQPPVLPGHSFESAYIYIGFICRTKTMLQLLCSKSKFPNHFAFTLGCYLVLLFFVQFI